MKILITNIVTLNAGDAAILYSMIDLLRAAFGQDTRFIIYDTNGDVAGKYYPELEFRKLLFFNLGSYRIDLVGRTVGITALSRTVDQARFRLGLWCLKHNRQLIARKILTSTEFRDLIEYKSADMIISSGGTYLVENYWQAHRRFDYELSLYLKRPLIFFTQTVGTFSDAPTRKWLRRVFDRAVLVLVRDRQSLKNLTDLGVKNRNIHVVADAAYALGDATAIALAKADTQKAERRIRVAISVREWRFFKTIDPEIGMDRYREAVAALSEHLINRYNAEITYLSTCQGMPEYRTDDSKIALTVVQRLPDHVKGSVVVDTNFHHPTNLAEMLKAFDLVIATRMHMAILALGVGTPVLPIAYQFKMHELFERLGQSRWIQDIETITPNSLVDAADSFLDLLPKIRKPLFAAVEGERQNALLSAHLVKEAFDQWQQSNGNIRTKG